MAAAACLLGYGEVGLWLKKEAAKPNSWVVLEGNPYLKWIESYSGEDYQGAVKSGIGEEQLSQGRIISSAKYRVCRGPGEYGR